MSRARVSSVAWLVESSEELRWRHCRRSSWRNSDRRQQEYVPALRRRRHRRRHHRRRHPPPPQTDRWRCCPGEPDIFSRSRNTPRWPRAARVQGVVLLNATISKEGTIKDLKVISGHPLLNQAAMEAVRQWRYKPQMLNGQPIEVITTITVNFTFQQ